MSESLSHGQSPSASVQVGESLEWVCHPVKRKPLVSVGVILLILLVPVLVFSATASIGFAIFAFVVMIASLAKFFFPTRYKLDSTGVTVKTTIQALTKPWSLYRSFYPDKNGVLLSPFVEPSRLENFRGLYVMFADNKESVVAFVGKHILPDSTSTGDVK